MAIPNQPPPSYGFEEDNKHINPPGVYLPPTAPNYNQGFPQGYPQGPPQGNNYNGRQQYRQNFFSFGDAPVATTCSNCNTQIVTAMRRSTGTTQWIASALICVFGFWCGCCLIPFCVDSWQDITHSCPNCNYVLGKHKSGM